MLKSYHFGATLLSITLSSNALAIDCTGPTKLNPGDLATALSGKTVCIGSPGAWEAQEEHRGGDELWDYHSGPNSVNAPGKPPSWDPTDKLGTWSISGNEVTYTYAGSTSYKYNLHYDGTTYTFCTTDGGTNTDAAKIVGIGSGCD